MANIILNGEKLKVFPLKTEQDRDVLFHFYSTSSLKYYPEQLDRQEIKGIWTGKEELKLSLYADDMILYLEDPKCSSGKLPDLIN